MLDVALYFSTHRELAQAKVASLSAIRFGESHVSDSTWELAELVMEHHRRVRAHLNAAEEATKSTRIGETGDERARLNLATRSAELNRVRDTAVMVLDHLTDCEEAGKLETESGLRRKFKRRADCIDAALELLTKPTDTRIEFVPTGRKDSVGVRLCTPEPQQETTATVSPVRIAPAIPPPTPAA